MFTETLTKRVLRSPLVDLLTGPHGVDRYTELVDRTWTADARAKVVDVHRSTPRSVTLVLEPNAAVVGHRAGQHVNLTVEIDGRRYTRCYSLGNAEGSPLLESTIGRHDGGLVSEHLYRHARPGMVVGLSTPAGEFVLPEQRPRRILFVSGGSGITPVMSMLRTLAGEDYDGEIAFVHYARTPDDACYRGELAAMPVRVLRGYTRSPGGELTGYFDAAHLAAALPDPDAVFVCGPPALAESVRQVCANVRSESFVPTPFVVPDSPSGGRITFRDSGIETSDDGRPLLEQAEAAGLTPKSGCRMGICHTCTRRKHRGAVRNLTTGAVSTADQEDVQICVSVPVGDVELAL
ncbi:ferredoxin reductase [Candidatus Mycolicibacterium alkanivorans]|uniref:Ferredoxin reductase n=1 Tax=Candidatus Mycolicibacterium alkanivorans TaxID=2954114 RepID=A0ABS9YSX2_9MYCO|nr:ferredoxin reductase [Candidatus Mycolicibacterium alkanivorans]MCI4673908.1 ferredoxin reductase [Candidatus Mycolicibacterium alkanivorans]